jgi:hypothetical protein
MSVGCDLARVVVVAQEATDELVKPKFLGARYLERVIGWRAEHDIGQRGNDVVRKDRLYQSRGDASHLSVTERIGDGAHELEELRGAQNRVGNPGSLDQVFLGQLRAEVAAIWQPVRTGWSFGRWHPNLVSLSAGSQMRFQRATGTVAFSYASVPRIHSCSKLVLSRAE